MSRNQVQTFIKRDQRTRARADIDNPQAFAICDGCGFRVMHNSLRKKMEYRGGNSPEWTGLMVCGRCDDVPQPFFQRQVLPPDPAPISKPRPDKNPTFRVLLENGTYAIVTEDGNIVTEDG